MDNSELFKRSYWRRGEPQVWAAGAALALTLLISLLLLGVILKNGLGVFWPAAVYQLTLTSGKQVLGELIQEEKKTAASEERLQFKIGNRDLYGLDFRWIDTQDLEKIDFPEDAVVLERQEYGNYYGYLKKVIYPEGHEVVSGDLDQQYATIRNEVKRRLETLRVIEAEIKKVSYETQNLHLTLQKLKYAGKDQDLTFQKIQVQHHQLEEEFEELTSQQQRAADRILPYQAEFVDATGITSTMKIETIVRLYRPNKMSISEKVWFYIGKIKELLFDDPREANTEGGLFPAIFGTVMMIFIMSICAFPLGVMAAIYLNEYAKQGVWVRIVRIAVSNLAGIPSIVYGVFGLGFFVYGMGQSIDQIFFPERLPTPTFGTGGVLWASLTLALLTLPVVIMAAEEALRSVPKAMREASSALGATPLQTLVRIVLPMASPGIMTGFILAMARAAGEVAPLMITGVVKLSPSLPLDGTYPFIHLERKFMHLGFHIYDVGFQSPNVEAAKPMVFVTTLLLVLIVLGMSSVAIYLRNKMKKRYSLKSF